MPFVRHDAGKGHRSWDNGDCTVRALAAVTAWSYEHCWEYLYKLQGEHKATSFKLPEFLRRDPDKLPVSYYIAFKAKRGVKRMTGEQFCKAYPTGRYLLRLAHHVTAVVNGNLIDTWDCSRKCVYGAWRIR